MLGIQRQFPPKGFEVLFSSTSHGVLGRRYITKTEDSF